MSTKVEAQVVGRVWKIVADVGTTVPEDEPIVLVESMKMEIPVTAPHEGRVVRLLVGEGDEVKEGQVIAEIE